MIFHLSPPVGIGLQKMVKECKGVLPSKTYCPVCEYGPPLSLASTPADVASGYGDAGGYALSHPPSPLGALTVIAPTSTTVGRSVDANLDLVRHAQRGSNSRKLFENTSSLSSKQRPVILGRYDGGEESCKRERAAFEPGSDVDPTKMMDYQGRSILQPQAALSSTAAACRTPKKLMHIYQGHDSGIQIMRWSARSGHLLFAADLAGVVKLWDVLGTKAVVATFRSHEQSVNSMEVGDEGRRLSTTSLDGYVRIWDVEAGAVITSLSRNQTGCNHHVVHPEFSSCILTAYDKEICLWDLRASQTSVARQYLGHLGAVMHLHFLQNGETFLSTSSDKTLRTWDFRVPIGVQQFADVAMQAIPHVVSHPHESLLAAQTLGNKVVVYSDLGGGKMKLVRGKSFEGHTVSGTACQLSFSHDGQFLSSGDSTGSIFIWDWASGKLVKTFAAHSKVCVSNVWHPRESSKLLTSSWDHTIKLWN